MMYTQLYQYFIRHNELSLPGIGTFLLERKPAETDFPNRLVYPPSYVISLQPGGQVPAQPFFGWLAAALGVSGREAIFRFNDFAFDMKKSLSEGALINWKGMGTLNRGLGGEVKFTPSAEQLVIGKPVTAQKMIRERSDHMVRVGEDQKTAAEMTEMLGQKEVRRSYWWAYALAVGLLAAGFIGWQVARQGTDPSFTSNTAKLIPLESGSTYEVIP